MPHLHTGPGEHDFTASAYVLLEQNGETRMWFHWHKLLNQWLQFGGHVEHHEHPWAAVLHELNEESGYASSQLQVLQPKGHIGPLTGAVIHPADVCTNTHQFPGLDHYHTDIAYAFITDQLPAQKPKDMESTKLRAMTRSEMLALPVAEIPASVREIALYVFDVIKTNWEPTSINQFFVSE
jgi:8-oxo-dGTP pyrophosphatase MutT (NUDIX family)